jgi:polar amino acid transport system substrate-binding protein
MKRFTLRIMTALVTAGLLLSACQAAPTAAKVRVATNAEFAPFEYVDEKTKEVTGFDIELMQAVATKENFQVEIINTGFDAMLAGLSQCQYDAGIAAITITEERQKQMLFSEPYTVAGQTVVVRKGNKDITGPDSLSKKTIGAQIGTTGAEEVGKIAGTNLKTYDNYQFAMQDLINGQIDAVVVDNPIADAFVAKNGDKLEIVGSVFTSENYGIAVCNKNPDLQKKINEGLAAMKADGSLKKLEEKWLVPTK